MQGCRDVLVSMINDDMMMGMDGWMDGWMDGLMDDGWT
jgi:hypothetical protein